VFLNTTWTVQILRGVVLLWLLCVHAGRACRGVLRRADMLRDLLPVVGLTR
jgi:hypothetical protein